MGELYVFGCRGKLVRSEEVGVRDVADISPVDEVLVVAYLDSMLPISQDPS